MIAAAAIHRVLSLDPANAPSTNPKVAGYTGITPTSANTTIYSTNGLAPAPATARQQRRPPPSNPRHSNSTHRYSNGSGTGLAGRPAPAPGPIPRRASATGMLGSPLPPTIDEDDPMLDYPPENWIASMIGKAGLVYRFSDTLAYKSNVTPREVDLMEAAGADLAMRPLTRVVWKGSRASTGTKAVMMELGRQFRCHEVPPADRRAVVIDMFLLIEKLHIGSGAGRGRGIVHGDVKESNFVWGRDGRLRFVDFSSARFVDESPDQWNSTYSTETYFTPHRMQWRDHQNRLSTDSSMGSGAAGGVGVAMVAPVAGAVNASVPAPTVFDDYYALAITLWSMYTGKAPKARQFNQRNIRRSDLLEVDDEMVRAWIRKVFKMAGCRFWQSVPRQEAPSGRLMA